MGQTLLFPSGQERADSGGNSLRIAEPADCSGRVLYIQFLDQQHPLCFRRG